MDRTEEFRKVLSIFKPDAVESSKQRSNFRLSEYTRIALSSYHYVTENEELLQRITRLATTKDFSSDPTHAMQELSATFERKTNAIEGGIQKLKTLLQQNTSSSGHIIQHQTLISQFLTKSIGLQVNFFKKALKEHAEHLQERNKRVQRYGHSSDQTESASNFLNDPKHTNKYAMFSNRSNVHSLDSTSLAHVDRVHSLRKAQTQPAQTTQIISPMTDYSFSSAESEKSSLFHRHRNSNQPIPSPYQNAQQPPQAQLQQQNYLEKKKQSSDFRFRQAERVESSLREMGQLFSRMASLIVEQNETLLNIEDDVESGHVNTVEGYANLQNAYEITKGSRGMILKIFALMIFFVFLFLWWT